VAQTVAGEALISIVSPMSRLIEGLLCGLRLTVFMNLPLGGANH
jgi:hypothetical protein